MNEFGTTGWGRAWLRLAEPLTVTRPDPQLPRARALARDDRVHDLSTEPGRITATVQDGGPRRVTVTFPAWDDAARAAAGVLLAAAGPDPDDAVVARLHAAGHPVAPAADEVHGGCDCRARGGRCRHVLATLIETARRVDESPALATALRGATPPAPPAAADATRIPLADLDPATFWG